MFKNLEELIEQSNHLQSDRQIYIWVYEAELFFKESNVDNRELYRLIAQVKEYGGSFDYLNRLRALINTLNHTLTLPEITERNQVFVAMWFSEEMQNYYDNGYVPAIKECNYSCRRIDEKQFNGSIIEEIVKDISNSIFLIADLTNNRGGVYYEAGIAKGLSLCNHPIQLILTCKDSYFHSDNKPHFDVSGDNIIAYSTSDDLKAKLITRIKGTESKR
ncbi:hypothetical protein PAA26_03680 [Methanomassiliicoccaceae archaeon COG_1]|nr:hypothetical protein [Methanomassiliicoccaceae archaeon COG_1]